MDSYELLYKTLNDNQLVDTKSAFKDELGDRQESNVQSMIDRALSREKKLNRQVFKFNSGSDQLHGSEKKSPGHNFNKEEIEEIMEKLVNRLVGSPQISADDALNTKIEKIFALESFQKMVENADIFADMSSHSFSQDFISQSQHKYEETLRKQGEKTPDNNKIFTEMSNWSDSLAQSAKHQDVSTFLDPESSLSFIGQRKTEEDQGNLKKSPSIGDLLGGVKTDRSQEESKLIGSPKEESKNQLEKYIATKVEKMPSDIMGEWHSETSSFFHGSTSFVQAIEDAIDEYTGDDDPGYDAYEVLEENFRRASKELATKYGFPQRSWVPSTTITKKEESKPTQEDVKEETEGADDQEREKPLDLSFSEDTDRKKPKNDQQSEEKIETEDKDDSSLKNALLPQHLKHAEGADHFYPIEFEGTVFDCYGLKVIYDRERTGFEETKDFQIVINSIIAGRYQVIEYLGSAAFSKAIHCFDMHSKQHLCMKIIENNKDYFDQSVDEIKLLRYINVNGDADQNNVIKIHDFFYHKEHLFIVTELLKDNLYEYSKYNREQEDFRYFTIGRLQKITMQILQGLKYIHSLKLVHCDLKPENILIKSYSKTEVKVIDFGSSCFIHDHLSSYVQSRSYRAPEVIIGCKYDYKIDMWSLGCILAEMWTGNVLFQNNTVQGLLARVIGIIGPFPEEMTKKGRLVNTFFTKEGLLYQEGGDEASETSVDVANPFSKKRNLEESRKIQILVPKKSSLKHRVRTKDPVFLDFIRSLLEIDPDKRPSADEAMKHPWFTECRYDDGIHFD